MAKNIETAGDWHWRNTMKPVKFFMLDARAATPFFLLLLHARFWTLYLCVLCTTIFVLVERRGYTVPAALRALKSWIFGAKRPGWSIIRRSHLRDYG